MPRLQIGSFQWPCESKSILCSLSLKLLARSAIVSGMWNWLRMFFLLSFSATDSGDSLFMSQVAISSTNISFCRRIPCALGLYDRHLIILILLFWQNTLTCFVSSSPLSLCSLLGCLWAEKILLSSLKVCNESVLSNAASLWNRGKTSCKKSVYR